MNNEKRAVGWPGRGEFYAYVISRSEGLIGNVSGLFNWQRKKANMAGHNERGNKSKGRSNQRENKRSNNTGPHNWGKDTHTHVSDRWKLDWQPGLVNSVFLLKVISQDASIKQGPSVIMMNQEISRPHSVVRSEWRKNAWTLPEFQKWSNALPCWYNTLLLLSNLRFSLTIFLLQSGEECLDTQS